MMHLIIFDPRMALLSHIHTYANNTAEQGWDNWCSVSTSSAVGSILQDITLETRRQNIHSSVGCVPGEENNMADAASQLLHLP